MENVIESDGEQDKATADAAHVVKYGVLWSYDDEYAAPDGEIGYDTYQEALDYVAKLWHMDDVSFGLGRPVEKMLCIIRINLTTGDVKVMSNRNELIEKMS